MTPHLGTLPDGSLGFDANTLVTPAIAAHFVAAGYRFVVRYVRRDRRHAFDLTAGELAGLLGAGLGVMAVQHVADPQWIPSRSIGTTYGAIAAREAQLAGVPAGVTVWCDLEGVSSHAAASAVSDFCNAWYDAVTGAGFDPGLYVGDACGLSAGELYTTLRFTRYWAAYNLNRDNYPLVRGVQMRQRAYPTVGLRVPDCPFEYDEDVIRADARGGTPVLLLP